MTMRRVALIITAALLALPATAQANESGTEVTVNPGETVTVTTPASSPTPPPAPAGGTASAGGEGQPGGAANTPVVVHVHVEPTTPMNPDDLDKTGTATTAKLIELAQAYWGYEPDCPGGYKVLVGAIIDLPPNPDGTGTDAAGESEVPGCFMRVIPSYWQEELGHSEASVNLCAVFIHEYGHSLGHPHTTNPESVMNPFTMYSTGLPSACREDFSPIEAARAAKVKPKHHARKHRKHRRHVRIARGRKHGKPDAVGARGLELVPYLPGMLYPVD